MPPKHNDSNSDLHSAPIRRPRFVDASTHEFHAYSTAIEEMLKRGYTSKGELEANIGRWVHLGQIIHTVHHFLSRLRFLKQRAENRRQISINKQCKKDLHFLLFVLGKCNQGIDLNFYSFPMTDSRLQIGLMPGRTRRVQPRRFHLAFLPP